jgi:PAS domain S-box-containing protein
MAKTSPKALATPPSMAAKAKDTLRAWLEMQGGLFPLLIEHYWLYLRRKYSRRTVILLKLVRKIAAGVKTRVKNISYAQVLVVILAFAAMVITSYYFMSDNERKHLRKNALDAIAFAELAIKSDLLEPETTVGGVSETVRNLILRGFSKDAILEYIININNFFHSEKNKRMVGIVGIYGVFEVFNGEFLTGTEATALQKGHDPATLPWYKAAVDMDGGIAVSGPFVDLYANKASITFSRRIFDDEGRPLAIIGLDLLLDRISGYAINTRIAQDSYGILFNKEMAVIAHPSPLFLGKNIRQMNDGVAIEAELRKNGVIMEREVTDYNKSPSVAFIQQFENGWYMAVIAHKNKYYQNVNNMAVILCIMGITMAALLSFILLNMLARSKKAEERTQLMFDTMPMCACLWDKDFTILDCNQEVVRMFGLKNKQEFCENFFNLSPEFQPDGQKSTEKCNEVLEKAFGEGVHRFEWMHQKLNGRPLPCGITLARVELRKEHVVVGYIRDLRELKAMLREMHRAEIAEESNLAKSKFLARVSHEVRTPMNAILGITEIQLQNDNLPHGTQEALDKIYNSGYLLLNIINDILDLSKIEAGKMEIAPVKYDVPSLINDTVHLNAMLFDSKPIELKLNVAENIPAMLFGDEIRIKQILNNLLSNAFKYTDEGKVDFSVFIERREETDMLTVAFRVADTGKGMSEEQMNRLFDEYTRFNTETNRATEGTGLGMAITKHLVDLMNGEIFVESEPGKGSAFTVKIPQKDLGAGVLSKEELANLRDFRLGRAMQMKKAPQIVREYMPQGKVLIVDDVETNLYVAKGLLTPYGLSVETAVSGLEAIQKVKAGAAYDIIFMDHFMPVMDGIEAAKRIRAMGYSGAIVALTANALTGQAEMFMENGFDEFISKPIDIRQLNAVLNKLILHKNNDD